MTFGRWPSSGASPQSFPRTGARYSISARTDNELYWSSYLYCGIFQLVEEGFARLNFRLNLPRPSTEILATELRVTDLHSGVAKLLAFDWRDNPDVFCPNALARCDVYFKRNFIPEIARTACPVDLLHRVHPLGLSFAVRGAVERPLWVRLIGGICAREDPIWERSARRTVSNLYVRLVKTPRSVASFLTEGDFEGIGPVGADTKILFQTRGYDPGSGPYRDDTRAVMEERAEYIRSLRAAFGAHFVGGFAPSPHVVAHYPDCVSGEATSQPSYVQLMRSCAICVYTRGLRDSPAFKLAEYLAAGRCIVAEEPKTRLPVSLRHGAEVLLFRSKEELISHCGLLLGNPELRLRLSRGARRYYEEEVRPRTRVRKWIEEAFKVTS
jgi:hypothetical protein